jgi:hypothetical protein
MNALTSNLDQIEDKIKLIDSILVNERQSKEFKE